ncbi:Nramp family divalent metal transporter [Agrococcus sp. SL85]|uniref:Nramp family divalent metal transporter n=1 Tax=Agrococcus sp. SL85 TaxID=2995141 RepID=UPI00226CBA9A|nr:Nramp family divalent metal transporter [Agrococcus sp. SL85]WAC65683.1 Nramp family divalent metal transporter [Agrococcus sp. SL85]
MNDTIASPRPTSRGLRRVLDVAGPGLIVAAAGVGAGDLIASLNAGASFGLTFAWAIIIGCGVKYVVTECIGRWSLATGTSPILGFHRLSKLFTGYFGIYSVILGFFYGAAIAAALGLTINAMFPAVDSRIGAIVAVLVGLSVLWIGRYGVFERIMAGFVVVMFVSIVGAALLTLPSLDLGALFVGTAPEGGAFYVLGIIGGVGMSIGLLSYGSWLRERGWTDPSRVGAMRLDIAIGYAMTFVFMLAMMVVGAAFLYGSGTEVSGLADLGQLAAPFADRFGQPAMWLLLIGMFSAVYSSLIGGYNALAHVFTDIVGVARGGSGDRVDGAQRSLPFRGYLVWMSIPPLAMLFLDRPVMLVLVYAALGALLMPVLMAGLLWLMNSRHMPAAHRNRWPMNVALVLGLAVFASLGVHELLHLG